MAPGFAIVLLVVALAALAPFIALTFTGLWLVVSWRPFAIRGMRLGLVGGSLVAATFVLLGWVLRPQVAAQAEICVVLFGAGFSTGSLCASGLATFRSWRSRSVGHA